jgi:tRNA (cytidine/uridine-2'-O-)-methyltransferase
VQRHAGFEAFRPTVGQQRLVLLSTKATQSVYDFRFRPDDVLLLGKESAGVPAAIADACEARVRIPMRDEVRSMNLAMSAAIALAEALRQTGQLPG